MVGKGDVSPLGHPKKLSEATVLALVLGSCDDADARIRSLPFFENCEGFVTRSIIVDEQFEIRECLLDDRADLLLDVFGAVVGGEQDRDIPPKRTAVTGLPQGSSDGSLATGSVRVG